MKTKLSLKVLWRLSPIILAIAVGTASAQNRANAGSCALVSSDVLFPSPSASKPDRPPHEAVIFGKEFPVPELHLRFINQETGKPITPKVVHVAYGWKWLEWPYPEHAWGAWSDAQDSVECTTGGDNELVVPERTVKPRGWYNGKYAKFPYTLSGKPYFDGLVVVVEFGNDCRPRLAISRKDLDKYRNTVAVLKLPCQWPVEVEFEKRSKAADPKPPERSSRAGGEDMRGWHVFGFF